jgi:peroxiredoxin
MKKVLLLGTIFISTNLSAQVIDSVAAIKRVPNKNELMLANAKQSAMQAIKQRETRLIGTNMPTMESWLDSSQSFPETVNKVVLYQFWNTTNPMCKAQMNAIQNLANLLKDSVQFEIVSVSYESKDAATQFLQNYSFQLPFYFSSKEKCNAVKQEGGFPTIIITDKKGIIQYMHCGGKIDASAANQFITESIYNELLLLLKKK